MNKQDLQLARTVLSVLDTDNAPVSRVNSVGPPVAENTTDALIDGSAIVDYDLNLSPVLSLPDGAANLTEAVTRYLRSSDQSDPWGLLQDDTIVLRLSDHPNSSRGRLLLFQIQFITKLLEKLFPKEKITSAEQNTLLQILSGLTLKQAAEMDSVSYETKKTQLKFIFQKTQMKRQQELSNFLITHLTLEVAANRSRASAKADSDEMFFQYVDRYMGPYVRASVIQESSDRRFRVVEIGDPAGQAVVCIHHLGLLNFSEDEIASIYNKRIRLICPLRHGALGPSDPRLSRAQHLDHAMRGIDLAVSLAGEKKVTIVSMLSGCFYAFKFLEKKSEKVGRLIMFGASYKPSFRRESESTFKKNLHQLAVSHEVTLDSTVTVLLDNASEPEKLRNVMKESHNHCDADFEVIDELFSDKKQISAMQHRLVNSSMSIVHDLQIQAESSWMSVLNNNYETSIHFIHGGSDTLIPIKDIRQLVAQNPRFSLHEIKQAGNWMFGKFTDQTFAKVRKILDQELKQDTKS